MKKEMIKSIYKEEFWPKLVEQKENGIGMIYKFTLNDLTLVYPFIKRKAGYVDNELYYDIATPRGQCGPYIINTASSDYSIDAFVREFNEDFLAFCKNEKIIAEYIKFDPWNEQSKFFSDIYQISFYGNVYSITLDIDFFMTEFNSKKRNEVRKAKKNNVSTICSNDNLAIIEFLQLYNFTVSKYDVGDYYKLNMDYLLKYKEILKDNFLVFSALYDSKVIASAIVLIGKDIIHYHYAAIHPDYKNLDSNTYLINEIATFGVSKRKKYLDLGSATKGSALEKFKKHISTPHISHKGTRIINDKIYNALIEKNGRKQDTDFFPEYRRDTDNNE